MKPFKSYNNAKPLTESERLPIGGYIVGILDANEVIYSWGSKLEIKFDIAEGEHRGFYTNQYKESQMENTKYKGNYSINIPKDDGSEQDNFTARVFVTNTDAIKDSNPGYSWDWDEKKLIGKKVGMIFRDKEYEFDGKRGFWSEPFKLVPIEVIRSGKFKIPKPKLLNGNKITPQGFASVGTSIEDDDLPF